MSGQKSTPAKEKGFCISRHMVVQEIIALSPQAADIMVEYGLHCYSCSIGGVETLEDGCKVHGMSDELIDELVDDINTAIAEQPDRKWVLTITEAAADGIADIAKAEGREGEVLMVAVDFSGGFCLEFAKEPEEHAKVFTCPSRPEMRVCALPLTLQRIGGATIDMRDGRFKLDLPDDIGGACGCSDGSCGCEK